MMNQSTIYKVLLAVILFLSSVYPTLSQANDAFAKAIANASTSPRYVLITIINDKTGTHQTICTLSSYLLGAIHDQYHMPLTHEAGRKCKEIALASKDHSYHFSQVDALRNLQVFYTPPILALVRGRLKNVSTPDLVKGFYNGKLHSIYTKYKSFRQFAAYRDALAYVLLERGLQPGQQDTTGGLYMVR